NSNNIEEKKKAFDAFLRMRNPKGELEYNIVMNELRELKINKDLKDIIDESIKRKYAERL
ncbi:MAG: hypothetical protein WCQ21_23750, partial [Verrucomicrobiota bacterium]